jgi:hypothetical protein
MLRRSFCENTKDHVLRKRGREGEKEREREWESTRG